MQKSVFRSAPKIAVTALALTLAATLGGCIATNRSVDSIHQPVVDRVNYTLDVGTGPGGLSFPEQRRLAGWFEAMNLRYGDRISIDDPLQSDATRAMVEALVARYGLLVNAETPEMASTVNAGTARIVVTRSKATVPGCPNWKAKSDFNFNNATSTNYGCAVNSNIASMIADPEHLIKGASGPSDTIVMSSTKAIGSYRQQAPTGQGALKATGTKD